MFPYNLNVLQLHNYAVASDGVLVHNARSYTSGNNSHASKGRIDHQDFEPGPGFEKEVKLPSGRRADAVNFEERHVIELKPNNLRAIARGEKQVEQYRKELEDELGGDLTSEVKTYD